MSLLTSVVAFGSSTATTASIDTTGATLLVVCATYDGYTPGGVPTTAHLSDSKSNTWSQTSSYVLEYPATRIFYAQNPTVGTGHTFTLSKTGMAGIIAAMAFDGTATASVFHSENGNSNTGTESLQTNSVTPATNGSLIVTSLCLNQIRTPSIDSSFTIANHKDFDSANGVYSIDTAYLIQGTAGAVNPTWSWTSAGNARSAAAIAVFAPAGSSSAIKTINGLAIASVKTVNGLAIASVKTVNGLA